MSKWIIDTDAIDAAQLEEMERHYDRWWSFTVALEKIQTGPEDQDNIKCLAPNPGVIRGLEEQQQAAYEAYTSLAGGLVHKAMPYG